MKYTLTFLTIVLMITSCNVENSKTNNIVDKFTWEVQLAGYDYEKLDEKGEIRLEDFILEFEKFPWIEQIESRNKIQEGCSPSLFVNDHKSSTCLWVSMTGDKKEYVYLIGYVYKKTVKDYYGPGNPKEINWVEIYLTDDAELVKRCYNLFFHRETVKLVKRLKKLKMYGEAESLQQ
ncbi:MAG: hypothetical protein LIR40_03315 [Bacteroidota bacterium]|nr:hypothetical protein [Bacteroidota bacterium]